MLLNKTLQELKGRKKLAFMAHVYAGDSSLDFSERLINILKDGGINILEIGIPFSDPIADGKVFQAACQRAVANNTTPQKVLGLIRKIRKNGFPLPIILTTYYNIIYQYGLERFAKTLKTLNVQGIIVPDLSLEESYPLLRQCIKNDVVLIYLIAPTTTNERIKKILKVAAGFVYLISVTGVTGTEKKPEEELRRLVNQIKNQSNIPVLVGFGISTPQQIGAVRNIGADGFVVGSQICRVYQDATKSSKHSLGKVYQFVKKFENV